MARKNVMLQDSSLDTLDPQTVISQVKDANGDTVLSANPTTKKVSGVNSYKIDADALISYPTLSDFPASGEDGKIYLAQDTNYMYRWSTSSYVQIGGGQAPVTSVNSKTGAVVLEISDIINAQHELSSDLVDDAGNTNKFVTTSEKNLWNAKVKIIEVSNITAISSEVIETIRSGDIVVKNESGNKHTYIASYKEDGVGLCLTYTDADNVETVSYDYLNGAWTYNSTDYTTISNRQPLLVNQQNIKSVNGQSLLGSGDLDVNEVIIIELPTLESISVSGTLTQAQITELQKDGTIIKYSNRLFYKQTASGNTRYFYDENIILANTKENYRVKTYENGKAYYCLYRTYPRKNTYIITPTSQNPEQSFNNAISQGYQISEAIPNPNIVGSWTCNPEAIYYSIVQPKVSIDINNARYHYHEDVLRDIYDKENIDALLDPKNNIIELPDNVTTGVLTNVNIEKLSTNIIIRSNLAYTYVKQETQTIDPPVRGETDQTTYISGKKYVLSQDLTTWYTPADLGYSDDDFDEYLFNYFIEEEGFHIRVLIDSAQIYTYHNIIYDSTNNCYKVKKIEISFTDGLTWTYSEEDDVYTKTATDTLLDAKANSSDVYGKSETYSKTETDTLLSGKANASSVYTKTETDTLLDAKANASDVYTKTESDTLLNNKLNKYTLQNITCEYNSDGDVYSFDETSITWDNSKLHLVVFDNVAFEIVLNKSDIEIMFIDTYDIVNRAIVRIQISLGNGEVICQRLDNNSYVQFQGDPDCLLKIYEL